MCYNIYSVWSSFLWSIPFSVYFKNGVRMLFLFSSQLLSLSDKLHFYLSGLELDVLSSLQLSREPLGYSSTTCTLLFINLRRLKTSSPAILSIFKALFSNIFAISKKAVTSDLSFFPGQDNSTSDRAETWTGEKLLQSPVQFSAAVWFCGKAPRFFSDEMQ